MKKLAINSFLAITAMAWTGQTPQAQTSNSQLREHSNNPSLNLALVAREGGTFGDDSAAELLYSPAHRQLLHGWLTQQPLPETVTAGLQRGERLEMFHPARIAMLPAEISRRVEHASGVALDLHIGDQVVRVMRNSRRIIDCVNV